MSTVLLLVHIMVALALVGVVLLQRSEGGALGIGGGGGGFMTGRSAGNALTKTTGILAAMFFSTSLLLSILASHGRAPESIVAPATPQSGAPALPGLQLPGAPSAPAPSTPPSSP